MVDLSDSFFGTSSMAQVPLVPPSSQGLRQPWSGQPAQRRTAAAAGGLEAKARYPGIRGMCWCLQLTLARDVFPRFFKGFDDLFLL